MCKRMLVRLLLLITAAGFAANVFAVASGLYIGIMGGPANNSASNQQAQIAGSTTSPPTPAQTITVSPKSQQFGSRIFVGYMVNQYAGFEGGATFFSGIRYLPQGNNANTPLCGAANARVRNLEFLGKGVMPFRQFNVFGKAGVAVAYQTNGGALNPSNQIIKHKDGSTTQAMCGKTTYFNKFVPAFSIGVGYDLSQNWVAEVALHNVQVGGKIGGMTMYAFGISYHFVDVYCGQFLC